MGGHQGAESLGHVIHPELDRWGKSQAGPSDAPPQRVLAPAPARGTTSSHPAVRSVGPPPVALKGINPERPWIIVGSHCGGSSQQVGIASVGSGLGATCQAPSSVALLSCVPAEDAWGAGRRGLSPSNHPRTGNCPQGPKTARLAFQEVHSAEPRSKRARGGRGRASAGEQSSETSSSCLPLWCPGRSRSGGLWGCRQPPPEALRPQPPIVCPH